MSTATKDWAANVIARLNDPFPPEIWVVVCNRGGGVDGDQPTAFHGPTSVHRPTLASLSTGARARAKAR